jgi:hypothetical protein
MNKKGVTLKKHILKTCWENNTDGAGILYVEDGRLEVYKELHSFKKFIKTYNEIRMVNKDNMVLHFRIATHGGVDHDNCHPFLVNNNLGFVHNGIIRDLVGHSKDKSDTNLFCEMLRTLPKGWERNEAMYKLVGSAIGFYNKLIFLNNQGEFKIVNEHEGVWDMGCWFSNRTYKDYGYTDHGGVKVYAGGTATTASAYSKYLSNPKLNNFTSNAALPAKKWYKEDVHEHFYEARDSKFDSEFESRNNEVKDHGYTSAICDCCLAQKDSKYNYKNMAYLCDDCAGEWAGVDQF